jgi:hypothetical protein
LRFAVAGFANPPPPPPVAVITTSPLDALTLIPDPAEILVTPPGAYVNPLIVFTLRLFTTLSPDVDRLLSTFIALTLEMTWLFILRSTFVGVEKLPPPPVALMIGFVAVPVIFILVPAFAAVSPDSPVYVSVTFGPVPPVTVMEAFALDTEVTPPPPPPLNVTLFAYRLPPMCALAARYRFPATVALLPTLRLLRTVTLAVLKVDIISFYNIF